MNKSCLYEYAVVRIVPRVEREEFVNAGIIVFCKKEKFLRCRLVLPTEKVLMLDAKANMQDIENNLASFADIAQGKGSSPIAMLGVPERFRWLTATRSTIIQAGKIHPGFADDLDVAVEQLFAAFVA